MDYCLGGIFMGVLDETVKQMNGYQLHLLKTDKFKTNTIVWKMKAPLNAETVTERALLPYVMQSNSKKFPTSAKLRSYLDDLYGASFFVDLAKKGEYHIITFTLEVVNEKFLSDENNLLQKALDFLSEVLTNPNVSNEAFDLDTVEKEKRVLKQRIQSIYDDKMKYANVRLVEEMCKGEPYVLNAYGDENKIDKITAESLYQYYKQAFIEDELDMYIIGNVTEEEVIPLVQEKLSFPFRKPKLVEKREHVLKTEVQKIKESQDVKQGKLNLGYRTPITYGDPDYFALQVFNGIFGGFPHSKLFINVREKASLAYYAASRLESHKGLVMVMSGIDHQNYDKALSIIHEQMKAMQSGDFTDEILSQTKAVLKNQLLETIDNARGMVEILYHNVVAKQNITLDMWFEKVDAVTKEDVMNVANNIKLDTIYFLTGTEVQG